MLSADSLIYTILSAFPLLHLPASFFDESRDLYQGFQLVGQKIAPTITRLCRVFAVQATSNQSPDFRVDFRAAGGIGSAMSQGVEALAFSLDPQGGQHLAREPPAVNLCQPPAWVR